MAEVDPILCHTQEEAMINLWKYEPGDNVRITCVDGQILEGSVTDIQDADESGFGEDAINIFVDKTQWIGIGQSEIKSVEVLN